MTHELLHLERIISSAKVAFLFFGVFNLILAVSMVIDLLLGVTKAKVAGVKIQSFKARKSAVKMLYYFGSTILLFHIDLIFILSQVYDIPYVSGAICLYFVLVEVKSWFERLSEKEQAKLERDTKVLAMALQTLNPKINIGKLLEVLTADGDVDRKRQAEEDKDQ